MSKSTSSRAGRRGGRGDRGGVPGYHQRARRESHALREAVMADPTAFARLEAILHPAVATKREAFLQADRDAPLVVLDVPLLFEAGGWRHVDRIAVVSAPAEVQRERVLARPGMTPERFEANSRPSAARLGEARPRRFRDPHRRAAQGDARGGP